MGHALLHQLHAHFIGFFLTIKLVGQPDDLFEGGAISLICLACAPSTEKNIGWGSMPP